MAPTQRVQRDGETESNADELPSRRSKLVGVSRPLGPDSRAVSIVVGTAMMLVLVIALATILFVMLSGAGDQLGENALAKFEFDEQDGQGVTVELKHYHQGSEFYLIDDSGDRIPGTMMEGVTDQVHVDVPCHGDLDGSLRVIGVQDDREVLLGSHEISSVGVSFDDSWQYEGFDDAIDRLRQDSACRVTDPASSPRSS